MRDQLITPVILAGGSGTRLWPKSRRDFPKQFLPLIGEDSLFQKTLCRVRDKARFHPPIVITNCEYKFLVKEQAEACGIELGYLVLEPVARNTAPAITASALIAKEFGLDDLYVMPSDHLLTEDDHYASALDQAEIVASSGALVAFGIEPSYPATGYGYIESFENGFCEAPVIARFIEKPDFQIAQSLIEQDNIYWNAGMFMFSASVFLTECKELCPEIFIQVEQAVKNGARHELEITLEQASFERAPNISVDYAIFENTSKAMVIPSHFHWSDVGSWDSVWKESGSDTEGNVAHGPVTLHKTKNSLVLSDGIQVSVNGVDELSIVASEDAIYVGKISEAQSIGAIVKTLASGPNTAVLLERHKTIKRPWGGYTQLLLGERFQVKLIFVAPGKKLSLQKHIHRSEHWIVVRGTAEITCDDQCFFLTETQSTYIPQGATHRISNPGKIELQLIEIQTGSYLGEDDIIRLEDDFGRAGTR